MMKIRKRLNQKGFTLVELMVVIAILGVLAAIAIPKFNDSTTLANTAKIEADLSTIDSALVMYQANGNTISSGLTVAGLVTAGYLTTEPTTPAGYYYQAGAKSSAGLTKGTSYAIDTTSTDATYGRAYLGSAVTNTSDTFYKN